MGITGIATEAPAGRPRDGRGLAIEVRGLDKSFRLPHQRVDSLKERAVHPFSRITYTELKALRDVSFEVHKGEFFGIVGRNGSGKSSLLKILAGIYAADSGSVSVAGRLAPFIELGVGFDLELTARENTVLNGVLMGLTKREAVSRFDAVIDFAELREFTDLRLKNYSSGMMVRLAFAVMIQADSDVMLVDEVLAVGDAAFAQRCMDSFAERKAAGKTVVLVTHDMGAVQRMCDRGMLLERGERAYLGDPEETAARYARMNFAAPEEEGLAAAMIPDINARVVEAGLVDARGELVSEVEQGQPISLQMVFEARKELVEPGFLLRCLTEEGTLVFEYSYPPEGERLDVVPEGARVRVAGPVDAALLPGSYYLDCWLRRGVVGGDHGVQGIRVMSFTVTGSGGRRGIVQVDADLSARLEPRG